MGFFDKLKGGVAFNRLAKSYKVTLDTLSMYNTSKDVSYLYKAAWIVSNCIIASQDKWKWNPFSKVYIPDYMSLGRITLQEANMIVMGKLGAASYNLSEDENRIINSIIDGNEIPQVEELISEKERTDLRP